MRSMPPSLKFPLWYRHQHHPPPQTTSPPCRKTANSKIDCITRIASWERVIRNSSNQGNAPWRAGKETETRGRRHNSYWIGTMSSTRNAFQSQALSPLWTVWRRQMSKKGRTTIWWWRIRRLSSRRWAVSMTIAARWGRPRWSSPDSSTRSSTKAVIGAAPTFMTSWRRKDFAQTIYYSIRRMAFSQRLIRVRNETGLTRGRLLRQK